MAKKTAIQKIAKLMRDLDFCMFTTLPMRGGTHSRPMSNNREVEFDGDVWFFSAADSRKVREIKTNPNVQLSYVDLDGWRFLSVSGKARMCSRRGEKAGVVDERVGAVVRRGPGKRGYRPHQGHAEPRLILDQK